MASNEGVKVDTNWKGCRRRSWPNFNILSQNFPWTKEDHEITCQDRQSPCRGLNRGPSEYEAVVVLVRLRATLEDILGDYEPAFQLSDEKLTHSQSMCDCGIVYVHFSDAFSHFIPVKSVFSCPSNDFNRKQTSRR
jgi:hypothetical protein